MKAQEKINQIETKIKEIKNLLNNWVKDIEKYNSTLTEITNQVNKIKNQTNIK